MILNLAVRRKLGTKAKPFMEFQIVVLEQGYRNRYDIIDHGHEKNLCIFFHRSIFTEIREFATIVLWKLVS